MEHFNGMHHQEQQLQQAAVAEYKFALKVVTTIGPKIKDLGLKTVNNGGKEIKLPVEEPLRRAHLLIMIGKKHNSLPSATWLKREIFFRMPTNGSIRHLLPFVYLSLQSCSGGR